MKVIKLAFTALLLSVTALTCANDIDVTSDSMEFDESTKSTTFIGDVQLIAIASDNVSFEADQISYIDNKTHAKGNVVILRDGKKILYTDSAVITSKDAEIIFSMERATRYGDSSL